MNVAIIIAGGVGSRVGASIPKQFIEIEGKPVLAYTLENFNAHPMIDSIELVCIASWIDEVSLYKNRFNLEKLSWIVPGGDFVQKSIYNGVMNLRSNISDDDIVVIHDGVRPLVDDAVLTDVIRIASKMGNGVSSLPYNEQIFLIDDEYSTTRYIPRETLRRVSTPQAYRFGDLVSAYEEAFEKEIGIYGSSYTNTMFCDLGRRLYFAKGSDKNIKLTTPEDIEIFKGYLKSRKEM